MGCEIEGRREPAGELAGEASKTGVKPPVPPAARGEGFLTEDIERSMGRDINEKGGCKQWKISRSDNGKMKN